MQLWILRFTQNDDALRMMMKFIMRQKSLDFDIFSIINNLLINCLLFTLLEMTSITLTKDNFISMIPKVYKFLDHSPKIIVHIPTEEIQKRKKFQSVMKRYESWDIVDWSSFISDLIDQKNAL